MRSLSRPGAVCLVIWLNLSMFWGWLTNPLTWQAAVLWFSMPSPLLSEERRGLRNLHRHIWWKITSEHFKECFAAGAIAAVILLTLVSLYTAESVSCSTGGSCFFASAHWADWLFGK